MRSTTCAREYRRIQLVFEHAAPEAVFNTPGITRVRRDGRVLTLLSAAGTEQIVHEAQALAPSSLEIFPVSLKEIFLETVAVEE